MAETDAFIFAALKQSKWLKESSDSISWTVSDLSSDKLIVLVLKFVIRIQNADDSEKSHRLCLDVEAPAGVAARHRMGSKLANILKELGYAGDCEYNHFLYPNEKETRNILSWLVGKLPRPELGENDDDDSKSDAVDTIVDARSATDWQKQSVLDSEQLSNIFSSWKREKTLHMLPNHNVEGLKGFQCLPLQTSPLTLPWVRIGKSTRKMFEEFPIGSVKLTSLLETLAVAKRDTTILLQEGDVEEEIETKQVGMEPDKVDAVLKDGGKNDASVLQEAQNECDEFAASHPQPFCATALPNVQMSLKRSSSESTGLFAQESLSMELAGSSNIDTSGIVQKSGTEAEKNNHEQSLKMLQKQLHETEHRIAAMRKVLDHDCGKLHQVEQHIVETQNTGQVMQKQLARQKQLVAMLPDAQSQIAKLEKSCKTIAEKKDEIARKTEVAREPLLKEHTELHGQKSSQKARCRQLVREIKAFRTEMQDLTGILHSKMESMQALEKVQQRQVDKLGKQNDVHSDFMTRNMYTSRIMDITKQVYKQKQDIAKILEEIKGLQKQLNVASEKLKRTEAVAEEKLYSAAIKSKHSGSAKTEAYVECYRKFAQLRELFEELIAVVGELEKKENAARDLRNSISQLEARESSNHLDKVLADLDSVRKENGALDNELRTRMSASGTV